MEQEIRNAILRTLAFFDAMDYAPTWTECVSYLEWQSSQGFVQCAVPSFDHLIAVRDQLIREGIIDLAFGRIALKERIEELVFASFTRSAFLARKMLKAQRIAKWLARFSSVRFVSVVNTTAFGHAKHEADLDFFVITRHGSIWNTRLFAVSPYRFLGKLANRDAKPDAVCLSYFISDQNLSLDSHVLKGDDPYFRYWFLGMLPLYDDGIGEELWKANASIRSLHPFAEPWRISPDWQVDSSKIRISVPSNMEPLARRIQMAWFPSRITDRMNRDNTVIVTDQALKFHVDDGRESYRDAYRERLKTLGIE